MSSYQIIILANHFRHLSQKTRPPYSTHPVSFTIKMAGSSQQRNFWIELKSKFQEDSNSDKDARDLTPAQRRRRDEPRSGSTSSNNFGMSEHVRSILWKLSHKQLASGDWKKLALHWAFTATQIKAIEHQYTGNSRQFDIPSMHSVPPGFQNCFNRGTVARSQLRNVSKQWAIFTS